MGDRLAVHQTAGRVVPRQQLEAALAAAARLHPKLAKQTVSVAIVGDSQMRRLNRVYHGVDATTDVLTFSLDPEANVEIIICYDQASRQAKAADWSLAREVQLLLIHGLLHSVGFDDQRPADERAMRLAEAAALRQLARPSRRS